MKTQHIIFLLSITLFCSCNLILSTALGVRSPEVKTEKYITNFAKKRGLTIDKILVVTDTFLLRSIISRSGQDMIFLADGSLVDKNFEKENPECSGNGMDFIQGFQKGKKYPIVPNYSWGIEQTRWNYLDGSRPPLQPAEVFNLNIVYYWGSFIGKPNLKKKINHIRDLIKARPDLAINFLIVNLDLREGVSFDYENPIVERLIKENKLSNRNARIIQPK